MKTINTVLPVYDKIEKQCYRRAIKNKLTGQTEPVPVSTPRHRLPSMLWNVEADDPGEITRIELIDKDGNNAVNTHGLEEWGYEVWCNISFGITSMGLEIIS